MNESFTGTLIRRVPCRLPSNNFIDRSFVMSLYQAALACLVAFCALGAFDGLYFHLIKYRLHEHPPARLEHFIHTLRGFVFAGLGLIFFGLNSVGPLLIVGCVLVLADIVLEIIDILVEKEARRSLGGIDPKESVIHVFASSLKFSAIVLVLLTKNPASFRLTGSIIEAELLPQELRLFAYTFSATTFVVSLASLVISGAKSANRQPQARPLPIRTLHVEARRG